MKKLLLLVAVCATTTAFTATAQDVKKEKKEDVKKEQVEEKKEEVKQEDAVEVKDETGTEQTQNEEIETVE